MRDLGYDLVVVDDDFASLGTELAKISDGFEKRVTDYLDSLRRVTEAAIQEGEVAANLKVFLEQAALLKGEAGRLAVLTCRHLASFVSETDRADRNVY